MARRTDLPPELSKGPFTVAQAAALGVSAKVLRGQRVRRVYRNVYVLADIPDSIGLRLDAVRLLVPDAVGSHHTAAGLRSLVVPESPRLHITVPDSDRRPRIDGVQPHRAQLHDDVRMVGGRPVLSVERTLSDLARSDLPLADLVIFGDAAVRHGWTTPEALTGRAERASGRGSRAALRAAALVRPRVDSPMETRLRLLLVLAGLPEPVTNVMVTDATGWIATPDLSYPAQRIAIEYDGDYHRVERRQWRQDKIRGRRLRDHGWELLECTADDVLRLPQATLAWVHERLRRAAHPQTPAVLSNDWRSLWTQVRST